MSTKRPYNPLSVQHFYAVDAATCKQTMAESQLEYSIEMGGFTLHHGTRHGAPVGVRDYHEQAAASLVKAVHPNGESPRI